MGTCPFWGYYFGARYYPERDACRRDPEIARFLTVDPLAQVAPSWNPYRYAYNDPMSYIDPLGMNEEEYDPDKDPFFGGVVIVVEDTKPKKGINTDSPARKVPGGLIIHYFKLLQETAEVVEPVAPAVANIAYGEVDATDYTTLVADIVGPLMPADELWKLIKAARPLRKMGHAFKHFKEFQKLIPNI
ncbi:MAG: RHS repeat-associated core domain-containing protein [Calditrichaceae bacterium]|nr:RHS repeat-associated core domain-containing protein [Calditrichaceae bacterium]MBN2707678.1 RHS repeat-associated core domain-containing protein [Calditrichaceae bacterium]